MKYLDIAAWELIQREVNHGRNQEDILQANYRKGKKQVSKVSSGNKAGKTDQEAVLPGSSEGFIEKQVFSTAKKRKTKNHLQNLLVEC